MRTILFIAWGGLLAASTFAGVAHGQTITRFPLPDSKFPIAAAVEIPAGHSTIYLSGVGADVADPKAQPHSLAAYGDMQTQTVSALKKISAELAAMKLTAGDVVFMHAYLVGDKTKGGTLDFAGFMKGYTQFFGTTGQPNLPARSAFQVAALANPGWLIEIEVTAVRK